MARSAKPNAVFLLLSAAMLSGCATEQLREGNTQDLTMTGVTTSEAVEAAKVVLGRMRFTIEKADAKAGVVRTLPLTGAQFFEFWRSDNVDFGNVLEANLHTLRRSVLLDFTETDGRLHARCAIRVQRLSLPENEVAGVSQAYRIHSQSTRTTQRIDLDPTLREGMSWIELGDDPKLAAEILRKIAQHIGQPEEDEAT